MAKPHLNIVMPNAREVFGEWLRERISERRTVPTAVIARAIGLSPALLCNILAGRRQMSYQAYRRLEGFLQLSGQPAEEGRKLWEAQHRPAGRKGSQALKQLIQEIHNQLDRLAKEADEDERHLIGAGIRNLIGKL